VRIAKRLLTGGLSTRIKNVPDERVIRDELPSSKCGPTLTAQGMGHDIGWRKNVETPFPRELKKTAKKTRCPVRNRAKLLQQFATPRASFDAIDTFARKTVEGQILATAWPMIFSPR
jgi:hypothetical protein